ncbi:MAG: hypothetical protein ACE5I1_16965 [bacterium]
MEHKSEGICRFCLKTFAGSAIGRHLESCKKKAEQDANEMAKVAKNFKIYHIRVSSGKYYWLHLEMPASATLVQLDHFLRAIWLECCGHLSAFTIHDTEYQEIHDMVDYDELWGPKPESMDKKLYTVMKEKDTFEYEYDFGSTSHINGKIIGVRRGWFKDKIKILARNNPYLFNCDKCKKEATDLCIECDRFVCEECFEEHECDEDMALPVANSPRMGVCGFEGGNFVDEFEISLKQQ